MACACFWKSYDHVSLVKYADFFIEVGINDEQNINKWIVIYASTDEKQMRE